ncbi:ABC transporter substrate-binding protein [Kosakonia oryzendophytica]|uniref:ABC transporter substrate-binding protein n=1 Tax=Kosakonia oryzendophytica TaxID=1005665 RepID=UPI003D327839
MIKGFAFRRGVLLAALSVLAFQATAAEKVTLQLKWLPQSQFAGYYVAQQKGFYQEEGLDVTIKPGGTDISPVQVIAGKSADVIVDWLPDALASREAGVPLVNIAQVYDRSGMMLTCKKSTGIKTPADLKGKTLGVWYGGNEYPFFNWMNKLGFKPGKDITILKQGFNVDPLLQDQAACISTMNYNEYWQLIDAGLKQEDLISFPYEDQGVSTLEDGLYVLGSELKDPAFVNKMAKFLKASFKGWDYAVKHPQEAAKIVVEQDASGAATEEVQTRQMENVAKLITNAGTAKIGYLDPAAYRRTIDVLLHSGGDTPVIKKDPGDAGMTHTVWDAAAKLK